MAVDSRNNMENSESMKYTKRTEKEFTKAAEELKTAVEGYMLMPSKWQGKINVAETLKDNALGIKEWDGSISVTENADDGVLIHELIHSSSVSHAGEIAYANNQKMEEGSVEYLKQEICKLLGIESANTYDEQVTVLRVLNDRFEYGTDVEFAKELVNIPLEERYALLEDRVDESLKEAGVSFEDFNEVLDFVKKLKGAFEK